MGTGTSEKQYGWEEDAPLTISTPENQEVLKYYRELYRVSSGDFFDVDALRQREIMLEGHTAMALMWSDYVQPLAVDAPEKPSFGFATIPGTISGLAGGAFYINRRSSHIQEASQFVAFALEPKNQAKLLAHGLCSPEKTAYTEEIFARVPYAHALYESLSRGVFMFEAGTDAEIISNSLTASIQKFIRGEINEKDALEAVQLRVLRKRTSSP